MTCYLCGGDTFAARPGVVRDDPSLKILECTTCGLVTLSSLEHIRAGHYENSGMHGAEQPSMETWLRDCAADDARRFEMLRAQLVNKRVLDFGCGAGGFVVRAGELAASIAGVEPEKRVGEYWGDRITIHPDMAAAGGSYDLITAFHVVEHLSDPRAVLSMLAKHLRPGGRIVIEVPSASDALLTLYESEAFQRFTYWSQHLFLFNAETLRRVAVQAGFRVTAVEQVQRYPLSNHLFWLSKGKPGGHHRWEFLNSPALDSAYAAALGAVGKCDTIVAYFEPMHS
jgi:2-polyprenyl-3-methyl-5-hydroxy-6-metoxy-1,4-benzoquinol methylase